MELARKELGGEALLVNARPAASETKHLGAYEVVFGVAPAAPTPPPDRVSQDIAGIKRDLARLAKSLSGPRFDPQAGEPEPYSHFAAHEIDPMIAQAIQAGAPLENFFTTDPALGRPDTGRNIVALVGPPGAGKTTTLIKLAARFGLASRRPARIVSADVFRIAAADQLRTLAAILGIGCDVAETPVALAQALEEHRLKDLIFIDTPGFAAGDMEDAADLARFLASHPEIDTHLVLPASMKHADLARAADRFSIFAPRKLLFTRLDETAQYGALVNESSRRSLPLSFLASGQRIPDDLEPATPARIAELIAAPAAARRSASAAA